MGIIFGRGVLARAEELSWGGVNLVKLRIGVNLVKLSEDEGDVDFALSVKARGSHHAKRAAPRPVGSSYNRFKSGCDLTR